MRSLGCKKKGEITLSLFPSACGQHVFFHLHCASGWVLKTASNCIIALHVTNRVKENKRTEKAEDLNFDSLTIITCKPNGRFNDSTVK